MSDDKTIRDQIIAAYIARAAALIDEARGIMEEVARLVLKDHGFFPTVVENPAGPEESSDPEEERDS